jgi:choline dehydrogenase-like flavoprotein
MSAENHYDVIIIGSGAGGGTLAYKLAPTGKRILILERGDWLYREKENWIPAEVVTKGRYNAPDAWKDLAGQEFHPGTHYNVGGNTKFYGAALWRLREQDFGELRHAGGVSPAWPVDYSEMEPYYAQAERLFHVHGNAGQDPTEPARSGPFPHPGISHEPRMQKLHEDLERIGHHPFPAPIGILLNEQDRAQSACIRCSTCDGFPCLLGAKADAETLCVRPALQHPNVSLLTRTTVKRLQTDGGGKSVQSVVAEREGETLYLSADVVVVSGGAINSAALMLRSASADHPHGLANSSGLVGRNYMCHNNTMLLALSLEPNDTVFHKTFALNDFYFKSEDWDFPLGCIQTVGHAHPEMLKAGAPPGTPPQILELMTTHAIPFWLTSEDLPDPENRVEVDADGVTRLEYRENNMEGHRRLIAKLKSMLAEIGCHHEHLIPTNLYLGKKIPLAGVAHQCGTMRYGTDPAASVVDPNCKAHDLDNLYVVDGSFFPSSSAVNPALTIIANALRVGDHLTQRLA